MNLENRILRSRTKLAALRHLLSQYVGELEFPNDAAHGLAWILEDIDDELEPLRDAPAAIGAWDPDEPTAGVA